MRGTMIRGVFFCVKYRYSFPANIWLTNVAWNNLHFLSKVANLGAYFFLKFYIKLRFGAVLYLLCKIRHFENFF